MAKPRPYVPPGGWYGVFAARGAPLPGERGHVEDPVAKQLEGARYVFDRAVSLWTDPDLAGWLQAFMFQMGAMSSITYTGDDISEEEWEEADWQPEDFASLIGAPWLDLEHTADVFAAVSESEAIGELTPDGVVVAMIADILFDAIDDPSATKPRLVVVGKEEATSFIETHHSELPYLNYRGLLYTIGIRVGRRLVAVATANSPTAQWHRQACSPDGIVELTRIASDGSTLGASSKLCARLIDLLPVTVRRGVPGCLFVTYSLGHEVGTTYLALTDKGLRPTERIKGKTPGGSRSEAGDKALMGVDKVRWEAGSAAEPPDWSAVEAMVPPEKLAGPKRNFDDWQARQAKEAVAAAARAARAVARGEAPAGVVDR